jgi:hypothetical protein
LPNDYDTVEYYLHLAIIDKKWKMGDIDIFLNIKEERDDFKYKYNKWLSLRGDGL